ncbi:MAG TPA: LysR family transcriptional regulator [Xanthobacteraceae bacterium]|nr:LysR family transcriptional regulator [Xanthobacteraceae bacterium]
MDRLDELAILAAIVEVGSLKGAARRLRRSAPVITRALNALESRVGARLVERTTRRLSATETGNMLAERARKLLAEYDDALGMSQHASVKGELHLTAPVQFGRVHVAPLVSSFLDAYPHVRVEFMLNDRNLDFIDEGLDVAVRIGPLADSSLVARKVGEVRRLVVASPAYLKQRGTPRMPADLVDHDTIFGLGRLASREWRFGPGRRGAVVRLSSRLLVDDVYAQIEAALAGRGFVRLLSYQVADALAAGTLVRVLSDYEPDPIPVHLVTLGRAPMKSTVRAFLDHITEPLAERISLCAERVDEGS